MRQKLIIFQEFLLRYKYLALCLLLLIAANPATAIAAVGLTGGCDVVDSINNISWKTETYAWGQGCQPAGTEITVSSNGYSVVQTASSICTAFEASGYSCGSVTGPGYYWASCKCVKN